MKDCCQPRTDYEATKKLLVQRATTGEGRFIRQAGFPRFGHVVLTVEHSFDHGLSFRWEVSQEQIPEMFRRAVCRGVSRVFEPGAKFGQYQPDGILVRVVGGTSHETDSNEGSFEVAAMQAFVMAVADDETAGHLSSSSA